MTLLKTRPTSRILGDIHALLMASNVKVHSEGQTLSFRGLVGETRITVSPNGHRRAGGLEVSETVHIESVVDMQLRKEMECLLNMQASTGALVLHDDGRFRIKSRFSLYVGESEDVIRRHAGVLWLVALTHTNALQAALVDAWQLSVSKAPRLDSAPDGGWESASFYRAAAMLNESGAFANDDKAGLTAEFPWDPGAFSAGLDSLATGPTKRTSLLQIERSEHPNLGKGLFCRLDLPLRLKDNEAFTIATNLNRVESTADDWPPFLGAWTSKPGSGRPTFVSFWSDSFANVIGVERIATWMADRARRLPLLLLGGTGLMTEAKNGISDRFSSQSKVEGVTTVQLQSIGTSSIKAEPNSGSSPNSTVIVHSGISAVYREGFQQAAAERGVQSQQMQSMTWESIRHISRDREERLSVKDNVESNSERRSEASIRKSAPQQILDRSESRIDTKDEPKTAKHSLRDGADAPVSTSTTKDYVYAALGVIAFFVALSFTQAGSVLLHGGVDAKELLVPVIVSTFRDMTSWAFWLASGSYFFVTFGSLFLVKKAIARKYRTGGSLALLGLLRMFVLPFISLFCLAYVLWSYSATLMGSQAGFLVLPLRRIAWAAAMALVLGMLLLAGLEKASLNYWKYSGFWITVTGTLIVAQLRIPEILLGKGSSSSASLYPGVLTVSTCCAFAILFSWLGAILANRLLGDRELRNALLTESIGVIGGFMSMCFLLEYARLAGA